MDSDISDTLTYGLDQLQLTSEDFFHQMIEEAKTFIRIKENGCQYSMRWIQIKTLFFVYCEGEVILTRVYIEK